MRRAIGELQGLLALSGSFLLEKILCSRSGSLLWGRLEMGASVLEITEYEAPGVVARGSGVAQRRLYQFYMALPG